MQTLSKNLSSWLVALVAVPVLLLAAGCDGGGDDNEAPTAQFTFSPANPVAGQSVTFDASGSTDDGQIASYDWEFGDGEEASGAQVTRTFPNDGNISVELTVTDNAGRRSETMRTIVPVGDVPDVPSAMSVNYDTTGTVITVTEQDGEGILPIDEDGNELGDDDEDDAVTWTSDYIYVLNGRVFVNDGQTLNIEAGTVVQGTADFDPVNTGTLLVARGGTLNAIGTADAPIIFTAQGDDTPETITTSDFSDRGNWGGVLLLGSAPNNLADPSPGSGTSTIEGFTADPRATYGCGDDFDCDENDSSGTMRYVSIRFGGFELNPGNEINGLTMGSVGSGTTIEYVEVASNLDDGFEWFGGTVDGRYLVASFVGDDSFDIDQGYTGSLQNILAVQGFDGGDRAAEHDGGDSGFGGESSEPYTNPQICNATYIGYDGGDVALKLREGFTGDYYNSIFTGFPAGLVEIENKAGFDSFQRFDAGELNIAANLAFGFPGGSSWVDLVENDADGDGDTDDGGGQQIADYLAANNTLLNGGLAGFSVDYDEDGALMGLDVFPNAGSAASMDADGSNCIEDTDYKGAFEPGGTNWADGWTALSQAGLLGDN